MISLPYDRIAGTLGIKFRRLDDAKPKYLNTPGIGTHLYNAPVLLHAGRRIGICEGEFDTITLDALCGIPAVGIPGVTHWKAHPEWVRLLDGREVFVFPDHDLEHNNPGEKLATEILSSIPTARIVRLPEPEGDDTKMDVNTAYLRYGSTEIRKRAGL
jgi:DNA primase